MEIDKDTQDFHSGSYFSDDVKLRSNFSPFHNFLVDRLSPLLLEKNPSFATGISTPLRSDVSGDPFVTPRKPSGNSRFRSVSSPSRLTPRKLEENTPSDSQTQSEKAERSFISPSSQRSVATPSCVTVGISSSPNQSPYSGGRLSSPFSSLEFPTLQNERSLDLAARVGLQLLEENTYLRDQVGTLQSEIERLKHINNALIEENSFHIREIEERDQLKSIADKTPNPVSGGSIWSPSPYRFESPASKSDEFEYIPSSSLPLTATALASLREFLQSEIITSELSNDLSSDIQSFRRHLTVERRQAALALRETKEAYVSANERAFELQNELKEQLHLRKQLFERNAELESQLNVMQRDFAGLEEKIRREAALKMEWLRTEAKEAVLQTERQFEEERREKVSAQSQLKDTTAEARQNEVMLVAKMKHLEQINLQLEQQLAIFHQKQKIKNRGLTSSPSSTHNHRKKSVQEEKENLMVNQHLFLSDDSSNSKDEKKDEQTIAQSSTQKQTEELYSVLSSPTRENRLSASPTSLSDDSPNLPNCFSLHSSSAELLSCPDCFYLLAKTFDRLMALSADTKDNSSLSQTSNIHSYAQSTSPAKFLELLSLPTHPVTSTTRSRSSSKSSIKSSQRICPLDQSLSVQSNWWSEPRKSTKPVRKSWSFWFSEILHLMVVGMLGLNRANVQVIF